MQLFISRNFPDGVGGSSLKKRNRLADDMDSDDNEKLKQGKPVQHMKLENKKMHVARATEVFGEAAKQRTSILKESTRKTAEINAAKSYGKFKNKIREGRADLRALQKEPDFDSRSSEAKEVKETIPFFKEEAHCIFEELELQKSI
jgi:hypothetical protein